MLRATETQYVTDIAFPQIGPERSRRFGDWLPSLKSNAVAIGALASYALFRLIVNSGRVAERPSLTFDWLIFVAAHVCMAYWAFRAFSVTRDEPRTNRAWLLIGISELGSIVGSFGETMLEILYHRVQLPLWIHLIFAAVYTDRSPPGYSPSRLHLAGATTASPSPST